MAIVSAQAQLVALFNAKNTGLAQALAVAVRKSLPLLSMLATSNTSKAMPQFTPSRKWL